MTLDLHILSPGQRRIITTLLGGKLKTSTYEGVATHLGISVGTVYQQLKRVRDKHPETYRQMMVVRKEQLAKRHEQALERAKQHSRAYFRRRCNRQYKEKHGYYPWERYAYTRKW
jgi:transposase